MPRKVKTLDMYLRLDTVNESGVSITLFLDGHESGHLFLAPQSYQLLGATLMFGVQRMMGRTILRYDQITWDESGAFTMPAVRSIRTIEFHDGPV